MASGSGVDLADADRLRAEILKRHLCGVILHILRPYPGGLAGET